MARFDDIRSDVEFHGKWGDRREHLIDLVRNLKLYPGARRAETHRLWGCAFEWCGCMAAQSIRPPQNQV